jgi:hypothetical protein
VVLVSVLGAGVLTVALMINEITERPTDPTDIQKRQAKKVSHQFFIFFAPLGSLFVYQLLIAADAAGQAVTVAIASLGAGAAMNALLSRALAFSTSVIEGFAKGSGSNAVVEEGRR